MEPNDSTHISEAEPRARVRLADGLMAGCIVAALAGSALSFSMSVISFLDLKDTVLAVLLVPAAVLGLLRRQPILGGVRAFLPLILFVLLPLIVSVVPGYPQAPDAMHRELARFAVLVLYGVVAFDLMRVARYRGVVADAFICTAAAAALLAILQRLSLITAFLPEFEDAPDPLYTVFGNSGLLGGYLAMAAPLAIHRAVTARVFVPYLFALALLSPAVALSGSRAAWIGSVAGTLLVLPWRELNVRRAAAAVAVIACTIGATFVQFQESRPGHWLRPEKKDTIRLRFWFWDGAARMAAAHPVIGVGPGNFAYWSPTYQGDALQGRFEHISNEAHTRFAHNEPLHFAAETGLIGVALLAWMLLRLLRTRGVEWGALAAAMVFAVFHFPLHSAPHALVIVLLMAMLLARRSEGQNAERRPMAAQSPLQGKRDRVTGRLANAAVTFLAAALATFTVWDVLLPSIALRKANVLYAEGQRAFEAYEKAIHTGRFHADAHANYANALLQDGDLDGARVQLEQALQGQDTGDLHLALGYIAMRQGDTALAARHVRAALHRWPENVQAREYRDALGD